MWALGSRECLHGYPGGRNRRLLDLRWQDLRRNIYPRGDLESESRRAWHHRQYASTPRGLRGHLWRWLHLQQSAIQLCRKPSAASRQYCEWRPDLRQGRLRLCIRTCQSDNALHADRRRRIVAAAAAVAPASITCTAPTRHAAALPPTTSTTSIATSLLTPKPSASIAAKPMPTTAHGATPGPSWSTGASAAAAQHAAATSPHAAAVHPAAAAAAPTVAPSHSDHAATVGAAA
mmetsp:Transcript_39580/g.86925  ORF Transcript_39580/g.86925 Transcript_39580/m.86925 type:complete len:233 (-) Transcript_39580:2474-3172(-)